MFGLKLRYWICIFRKSIRVSHTLEGGREIQYKSICPADFDMYLFF